MSSRPSQRTVQGPNGNSPDYEESVKIQKWNENLPEIEEGQQ